MSTETWNKSLLLEDLKVDKWLFSKKSFITIFSIGALVLLKPFLDHLTNEYLVTKNSSSSARMDIIVTFIGVFMLLYGFYKFKLKYQPSLNHILMILLGLIAYSLFRFGEHLFNYDRFKWSIISNFYYLDFIVFTGSVFPFINLLCSQIRSLKKYRINNSVSTNTYFEDRPINQDEQNEHLVKEICDVISSNNFMGSFSIGIMGTWGHGKSSFIQALKSKLKTTPKANQIIEINFSPFLSHKEEDVISDFFKSFSNQLSPYSGQLSQSLLEYAGSITKFYKRGEVSDLLSNVSITNNNPAFELYNDVNDLIGKTGRKIVVYIDDLDRLSSKEILQIFKLIRNTSNFRNTFFILALDKTYVVNALAADKSFMESNFIDKFFQLEVFLPEINEAELATYLFDLLAKSNRINEEQVSLISQPIRDQETLFGNYIKNYRDCIRLANQIIFDHSVLENLFKEVSIVDTLNLIFLRTRFPQIFNDLHQNRRRFLAEDKRTGRYFIRKTANENEVNIGIIEDNHDYSDYKINDLITANKSEYNYTAYERSLIFKTLVALFGKSSVGSDSIMHWRNFNKLMRLRHDRNDLRKDEFSNWLSSTSRVDQEKQFINDLLDSGKGNQLVDKISSHIISSKDDFLNVVLGAFQLLKKSNQYQLDKYTIFHLLNSILKEKHSDYSSHRPVKKDRKKIICDNYLKNNTVQLGEKIQLLLFIKDSDSWGFEKSEINIFALEYFDEYLNSRDGNMWDVSDYTFYDHYNNLKAISSPELIRKKTIEYLVKNNISIFCAQTIDIQPFNWSYFSVSSFVHELFDDYLNFEIFLNNHKNKANQDMIEYIEFYHLWSITHYKKYIKFVFSKFDISHLQNKISSNNADGVSGKQIFVQFDIESKDYEWHFIEKKDDEAEFTQEVFVHKDYFYVRYNSFNFQSHVDFLNYIFDKIELKINSIIEANIVKDIDEINLTAKILKDEETIAELYSIQYENKISSDII